jgi:hypothetical protein
MDFDAVPASLRERLGTEATGNLLSLFDLARREWRADLIAACTERYERRLSEEIAGVRVQLSQVEASLRTEIAQMGASIRQDMAQMGASIRQDMAQMGAGIRNDMAAGRVELFKWCFIFWIGQVLAITGIMGVMLRLFRP